MIKISAIIPNYNHAKYLKQRIDSVLNQTYKNIEVIILDDFSKDNSRDIIDGYAKNSLIKQIIYNKENSGSVYKQWFKGISMANGDYIWIAESDDWAEPDFLEKVLHGINSNPNVGIGFSDSYWVNDQGKRGDDLSIHHSSFFKTGKEEIKEHLIKYNTIQNASAVLIRTDLAKRYMANILNYKSCGDWCLYLDVLYESNLIFIGSKLNNFRWYHDSVSSSANSQGLWINEGLRIVAFSKAASLRYQQGELSVLLNYWLAKANQFESFQKLNLQLKTFFYFCVFKSRILLNTFHK